MSALARAFRHTLRSGVLARPAAILPRYVTTSADEHFLVTATGPDRVGIVKQIAKTILDNRGDINESRMMRMGGDFTVMMRVAATKPDAEVIANKLKEVSGMAITTHQVSSSKYDISPKAGFRASFNVVGINHPGLVYRVTDLFYSRGCRVERLQTETKLAPFGGTVLFIMDGEVVHENPVNLEELQQAAAQLEASLGIELQIEEMSADDNQNFEQDPVKPTLDAAAMRQSGTQSSHRADL